MEKQNNIKSENIEETPQESAETEVELTETVQKLATEILRLREESEKNLNDFKRELAENDNLRKRHHRELDEAIKFTISGFAKDLIEVMESFHKAVSFKDDFDTNDPKIISMFDGMDMTLKLLEKAFKKHELIRIYPLGDAFDHSVHQSISTVSDPNVNNNQIIDVIQAGYVIHGRLLKPALVVVNMIKKDDDK